MHFGIGHAPSSASSDFDPKNSSKLADPKPEHVSRERSGKGSGASRKSGGAERRASVTENDGAGAEPKTGGHGAVSGLNQPTPDSSLTFQ